MRWGSRFTSALSLGSLLEPLKRVDEVGHENSLAWKCALETLLVAHLACERWDLGAKKTIVLVVENDAQTARYIIQCLQAEGFETRSASDGAEALQQVKREECDLLLLDLMMPRLNGFEVCEHIRRFSPVPIIVLTALGGVEEKARAFDLGADDYLTKPFAPIELLARVRAVLRRSQMSKYGNGHLLKPAITVGRLAIDFAQHEVTLDDRPVALTPIEYRLLNYLAQHLGKVCSHELLLTHVWGEEYAGEGHLLSVNINRLRGKIEPDPARPTYLITRPGFGYLLLDPAEGASGRARLEEQQTL
jgi:DNA-binding response OmpR family regulator